MVYGRTADSEIVEELLYLHSFSFHFVQSIHTLYTSFHTQVILWIFFFQFYSKKKLTLNVAYV